VVVEQELIDVKAGHRSGLSKGRNQLPRHWTLQEGCPRPYPHLEGESSITTSAHTRIHSWDLRL